MAVIMERTLAGGGVVRLHDDYLPKTEAEQRASERALELTIIQLVREGSLVLPGVERGAEIDCKVVKRALAEM